MRGWVRSLLPSDGVFFAQLCGFIYLVIVAIEKKFPVAFDLKKKLEIEYQNEKHCADLLQDFVILMLLSPT